jgi:tRNA (pseudouridine54-N1)-methyltransferase
VTADDFARGAALYDAGAYWEAHEAWEVLWRAETDEARRAWLQGLIQVAAALHKLVAKKDVPAARRILSRALPKLEAAGSAAMPAFVEAARACHAALERCDDAEAFDPTLVPRLSPRVRRFVLVGQTACASGDFSLDDIPSTSGRLDVLVRALRAALLVSHGVRRDTIVYLLLLGGPRAPRVLRVDGATARFLRPDERSLAVLVRKSLAADTQGAGFVTVRPGISIADGGLEQIARDLGASRAYVLDEAGADVRDVPIDDAPVFFVGDHRGFDEATRAHLAAIGATPVRVGPVSLHADDALAVLVNEIDRRRST